MLEPYVLKGTRTVLRRGGESNLSNLSDMYFFHNNHFIERFKHEHIYNIRYKSRKTNI